MKEKYYEFKKEKSAIEWISNNYGNFIKYIQESINIDGTLGNALFCYTGNMSKNYNNFLKLNKSSIYNIDYIIDKFYDLDNCDYIEFKLNKFYNIQSKKYIKLIYNSFSLNKINENIKLFHYFNIDCFGKIFLNSNNFEITHFISTTMIKKSLGIQKLINDHNFNSVLEIKVKNGTPCIPILWKQNQSNLKEYEIILKPKSKFIVNKIKKNHFSKIKYIIECEII